MVLVDMGEVGEEGSVASSGFHVMAGEITPRQPS